MKPVNSIALAAFAASLGAFLIGIDQLGFGTLTVIAAAIAAGLLAALYATYRRLPQIGGGFAAGGALAYLSTFDPFGPIVTFALLLALAALKGLDDK